MSFPLRRRFPPLTRRRLQEIQRQYGHDPVVRRLLWEIKCLQVVIMRARQLEQHCRRAKAQPIQASSLAPFEANWRLSPGCRSGNSR